MIVKTKNAFIFLVLIFTAWLGWTGYQFFFDVTIPQLTINGLENDGCYAGDVQCTVASTKTGEISIWLDGQPLVNQFKLNAKESGHPFVIPTKTIANGAHTLKVTLADNTFRKNKATVERGFTVDNVPLQSALIKADSEYKVFQGRTVHVQFQVNKPIRQATLQALSETHECFPESKNSLVYECFVPITCEETPNEYLFVVDVVDHVGNTVRLENKFQVVLFPFKKATLQVSQEKVKQEEELGLDTKLFEQEIENIVKNSRREKLWRGAFCTPIDIIRVSGEFGVIRTAQHKGRYAHKALDIINQPKSVVWATQDGIVVLKERYAHSGKTVIIDHGWGILSLFFHLDNFANIEVGDAIAKGNPIGTLGKTGYASGYHLHWEMRVNNIQVDPMQWTKTLF